MEASNDETVALLTQEMIERVDEEQKEREEEAKEGVYAGTYYAAIVIPEEFSEDALSFIQGSLINPKIKYYEKIGLTDEEAINMGVIDEYRELYDGIPYFSVSREIELK